MNRYCQSVIEANNLTGLKKRAFEMGFEAALRGALNSQIYSQFGRYPDALQWGQLGYQEGAYARSSGRTEEIKEGEPACWNFSDWGTETQSQSGQSQDPFSF